MGDNRPDPSSRLAFNIFEVTDTLLVYLWCYIFSTSWLLAGILKGHYYNQWQIQDFPDGEAPISEVGTKPIIWENFAENCMKVKEIGPSWGVSLAPPPDPPMTMYTYRWSCRGWGSTVFSRSTCRCEFHHRCTCTSVLHSARPLNTPTPRNTGYSSTVTQAHSSFLKIHTLSRRDSFTLDELERNKFWT